MVTKSNSVLKQVSLTYLFKKKLARKIYKKGSFKIHQMMLKKPFF